MGTNSPDHYGAMFDKDFRQDSYTALYGGHGWMQLSHLEKPFDHDDWKFRVSIHPEDVRKAWNIVVEKLLADDVAHCAKVALPWAIETLSDPANPQAGKMITIYTDKNVPHGHYKKLLRALEEELAAQGIRSGIDVDGDRKIPGSNYISYRNDGVGHGRYVPAAENVNITQVRRYNPEKDFDPYKDLYVASPLTTYAAEDVAGMRLGNWQACVREGLTFATRVPVGPEYLEGVVAALARKGFNPEIHESVTLGTTVSLSEDEARRLMKMQDDADTSVALGKWRPARAMGEDQIPYKIARIPVKKQNGEPDDDAIALHDALVKNGFHPEFVESGTLGLTLRLSSEEAEKITKMQELHQVRSSQMISAYAHVLNAGFGPEVKAPKAPQI